MSLLLVLGQTPSNGAPVVFVYDDQTRDFDSVLRSFPGESVVLEIPPFGGSIISFPHRREQNPDPVLRFLLDLSDPVFGRSIPAFQLQQRQNLDPILRFLTDLSTPVFIASTPTLQLTQRQNFDAVIRFIIGEAAAPVSNISITNPVLYAPPRQEFNPVLRFIIGEVVVAAPTGGEYIPTFRPRRR